MKIETFNLLFLKVGSSIRDQDINFKDLIPPEDHFGVSYYKYYQNIVILFIVKILLPLLPSTLKLNQNLQFKKLIILMLVLFLNK